MPMIKKVLTQLFFIFILSTFQSFAEEVKKVGKYKDWETMVLVEATGNTCFAQSSPVLQACKTGDDCAKHVFPVASTKTIVSQSLYFPTFFTSSAKL